MVAQKPKKEMPTKEETRQKLIKDAKWSIDYHQEKLEGLNNELEILENSEPKEEVTSEQEYEPEPILNNLMGDALGDLENALKIG